MFTHESNTFAATITEPTACVRTDRNEEKFLHDLSDNQHKHVE